MSDYTLVQARLVHGTENAVKFYLEDFDEERFVPRSVLGEDYTSEEGGEVEIETWWLQEKGLID